MDLLEAEKRRMQGRLDELEQQGGGTGQKPVGGESMMAGSGGGTSAPVGGGGKDHRPNLPPPLSIGRKILWKLG